MKPHSVHATFIFALITIPMLILFQNCDGNNTDPDNLPIFFGPPCDNKAYCYIFATEARVTGNIDVNGDGNAIPEADSLCSSDLFRPNGSIYKAMIVDASNRIACTTANCGAGTVEQVDWVLKPSQEYRRPDNLTVIGTTSVDGLFDFPLLNSISTAASPSLSRAWTGLNVDWTTLSTNTCMNWTSTDTGDRGVPGLVTQTSTNAISRARELGVCPTTMNRIYCVEQ